MLDIGHVLNFGINVGVDEVAMVREPADSENNDEDSQHFHNLQKKKILFNFHWDGIIFLPYRFSSKR